MPDCGVCGQPKHSGSCIPVLRRALQTAKHHLECMETALQASEHALQQAKQALNRSAEPLNRSDSVSGPSVEDEVVTRNHVTVTNVTSNHVTTGYVTMPKRNRAGYMRDYRKRCRKS